MTLLVLPLALFCLFNVAIEPNFQVSAGIPIFGAKRHEGSRIQTYFIWHLFDVFRVLWNWFWFWLIKINIKFERLGVVNFKWSLCLFLNTGTTLSLFLNSFISLAVRNIWWISIGLWRGSHIAGHFCGSIKLLERWNLLWPLIFRATPLCLDHVDKLRVESDLGPWGSVWGVINVLFLWEFVSLVYFALSESFLNFNFILSELGLYFPVWRVMILFFGEESLWFLIAVFNLALLSSHVLLFYCGLWNCLSFIHIFNLGCFEVGFLLLDKRVYPFRNIRSCPFTLMRICECSKFNYWSF